MDKLNKMEQPAPTETEKAETNKVEHRGRKPLPKSEKKQKLVLFLSGADLRRLGGKEGVRSKFKKFLKIVN